MPAAVSAEAVNEVEHDDGDERDDDGERERFVVEPATANDSLFGNQSIPLPFIITAGISLTFLQDRDDAQGAAATIPDFHRQGDD